MPGTSIRSAHPYFVQVLYQGSDRMIDVQVLILGGGGIFAAQHTEYTTSSISKRHLSCLDSRVSGSPAPTIYAYLGSIVLGSIPNAGLMRRRRRNTAGFMTCASKPIPMHSEWLIAHYTEKKKWPRAGSANLAACTGSSTLLDAYKYECANKCLVVGA
jgi:hypothetical protein